MTRGRWLWGALAASTAAHALFAWQLSGAARGRRAPPGRDTFEVRMVPLPPPASEPAAEPEPAPPPPPPKPVPRASKPTPAIAPARAEPARAEPARAENTTAPAALLAQTGSGAGAGVVQLEAMAIGAISTSASPLPPLPQPVPAARRRAAAPVAKLSDLSRKPKAPPLDAALRQNYPTELRRRGTQGQAEVRVVIDPRGRVGEIAVVSESAAGFAEACRKTLMGSRWSEPLDREGQPVSTRLTYRCRFQIER